MSEETLKNYFEDNYGPRLRTTELENFLTDRRGGLQCRCCGKADVRVERSDHEPEFAFMIGHLSPSQDLIQPAYLLICEHCGDLSSVDAAVVAKWRGTHA